MTIEGEIGSCIFHKLANDHDVNAIVGTRIYPVDLPQGATIPAITYQLISDAPSSQPHGEKSALPFPRYQVNCWDVTDAGAIALKAAVKTALENKKGIWGGSGDEHYVFTSQYMGQREVKDTAARLYCRQLDFKIMFT
jgi:hypothetical protein